VLQLVDVHSGYGRSEVIHGVSLEVPSDGVAAVMGHNGAGKTTLLRAIAGIWPFGRGTVNVPRGAKVLFLPQRPYLPIGTLRHAVAYPGSGFADEAIRAALYDVGLDRFVGDLERSENWAQVMSGGEQQRLAFARALLYRPSWLFLDEATSALDEAGQADLLDLLRAELTDAAIVSVGHRPGLEAFHDRTMTLMRAPEGARLVHGARARRERRRAAGTAPTPRQRRTFERLRAAVERNWRRTPAADA